MSSKVFDVRPVESPPPPASEYPARKHVERWRGYNRRRWELEKDVLPADERAPFVCECTSDSCSRPIEMTMREFEDAHMCPSWCATIPGHIVAEDGSRVHSKHPDYWVVELHPLGDG